MAGKGSAPGERRGGRKKGTPNKLTANTREALVHAFGQWGGVASLVEWAKKNPTEFLKLWVRTMPQEHAIKGGLNVRTTAADAARNGFTNGDAGDDFVRRFFDAYRVTAAGDRAEPGGNGAVHEPGTVDPG